MTGDKTTATNSSTRILWKGAISFGLVHIPVALHSATSETGIDFDWLDKRTMDPVGYKRVNKLNLPPSGIKGVGLKAREPKQEREDRAPLRSAAAARETKAGMKSRATGRRKAA